MKKFTTFVVLVLTAFFFSNNLQAETHYMLANCMKSDSVCGDANKKRTEALKAARWHANKNKGSGVFKFILQADSDNTVTEYTFNYFQGAEIFEGPNGRDMSFPVMEVYLTREQYLTGVKKEAAEWLVSPKYNTKLYINEKNLSSSDGFTIDMDSFCRRFVRDRRPEDIIADCSTALRRGGIFNTSNMTIEVAASKLNTLTGSVNAAVNVPIASLSSSLTAEQAISNARKIVVEFGKPIIIVSNDGYELVLSPKANGKIVAVELVIPPNVYLPLTPEGAVDLKKVTEKAAKGDYRFNSRSKRFVQLMADRTGLAQWRRLATLLDEGFNCPGCKVTIKDLPKS